MTRVARFEAFVREFQDMVFATAVRLLQDPADAEDVAQTVFLKAYERFDRVVENPAAAGWLKTVTTNLCLKHLSRYRRRRRLFSELDPPADPGPAGGFAERLASSGSQVAELEDAERRRRLQHALRLLPVHQRVPLVLFHFDAMSYEAIAARLGVSLAKVKSDMHRGRLALKQALTERDDAV